ncbi:hypothetical protein [Eubacterium aggregans]|uniref:hypothetical protein n=1 Tax=Eubacterium aggregans TaxID=81409 RepID=UPI003F2C3CC6
MDNQTKKCRYCHSEMDGNARVCPVCHRKQQGGTKKMILLVALGLAVLLVLGSCMMNSGKKMILPANRQLPVPLIHRRKKSMAWVKAGRWTASGPYAWMGPLPPTSGTHTPIRHRPRSSS